MDPNRTQDQEVEKALKAKVKYANRGPPRAAPLFPLRLNVLENVKRGAQASLPSEGPNKKVKSWIDPPAAIAAADSCCQLPRNLVYSWEGHPMGVGAIRFFPKNGHLIMTAGIADSTVKNWDVNSRNMRMTYSGHDYAVRDICFSHDGSKFFSSGYDTKITYWDTETGMVISSFPMTGNVPRVVKVNPEDDKSNMLLAGMSDSQIIQWDVNTGNVTQRYYGHSGAVNTLTFVGDNKRFVSSSEDQTLCLWECGVPAVRERIQEAVSMPSIALHPTNSNCLAAQSYDNQIRIYSTREHFHLREDKRFLGHSLRTCRCQVNFSPDGRFVMCGDGLGRCFFWEWQSCKFLQTLNCHKGSVCFGAEWHPSESSMVATCGWDGFIKYWA